MEVALDATKFVTMDHQVGGHATEKTSLRAFGGQILKPFQSKQRGEREHEFYERVFGGGEAHDSAVFQQLRPLLPGYRGLVIVGESDAAVSHMHPGKYLALEDLTWGRAWPCIMDVKVGTRSYEDGASEDKIAYERSKFPLQPTVGFRVQGIKVYDATTQNYVEHDKHVGRSITKEQDLVALFAKFFPADTARTQRLLRDFIARLALFERWFETQQQFEFIASSLLFLYDGAADAAADSHADIRLIDFAHVQYVPPTAPRRDDGVLRGVGTLRAIFEQLLAAQPK